MRKPMTAEGAPSDTRVPRTFFSRMFRWGIGFWLLMWIGAACVYSNAQCNIKGLPSARLGVYSGSVGCSIEYYSVSPKHYFKINPPTFIWSRDSQILLEEPLVLRGLKLAGPLRIGQVDGSFFISFPISGFLGLWLVWGWWLEPKQKHERIRRAALRIAFLILLLAMSLIAGHISKKGGDLSRCHLNIRNIQQAVRSHQGTQEWLNGAPLPWDEIFGPGGLMNKPRCPSGGEYELSPVVPELGKPAARCRNPEHQRSLEKRGTVGW